MGKIMKNGVEYSGGSSGGGGGGSITVNDFQVDSQNISASYAKYIEIGSMVFVDCLFIVTTSTSANESFFSGLPTASNRSYFFGLSTATSINRFYCENGHIYTVAAINANESRTYHIYGSYIKAQTN